MIDDDDVFFDAAQERLQEAREEFGTRRRWRGCPDRMCGASDCPTCFPFSYDEKEESEETDEEE